MNYGWVSTNLHLFLALLAMIDILQFPNNTIDESTELNLAQTGSYIGPSSIREYVEFINADFFQFLKRSSDLKVTPILLTDDLCSINIVTTNKAQIKNEFNPANKCLENVIAYTIHFKPEPFLVKNIPLFYPEQYLSTLFGEALGKFLILNLKLLHLFCY